MEYKVVIGLEVHAELKTESKIFCSCSTAFGAEANTQVCEICTGMPGTLPKLNEKVLEYAVRTGLALNCDITKFSRFDRKNYFYPDLPKAYQISQLYLPICTNGYLEIDGGKRIRIHEMHMEEDAGKLIHDEKTNRTLINYNRCGVPLIEIVTEPDFESANEAVDFLKRLKALLEFCGVSDCKMQEGSLRADVNVSVMKEDDTELGTRCEMKNMSSFKAIESAINYESKRQIDVLENGGTITQQTLRFDEKLLKTFPLRSKEEAKDYKYFPEPDLPPITITDDYIKRIKNNLPELPEAKRARYKNEYNLSDYDTELICSDKAFAVLFEKTVSLTSAPKECANWICGEVMRLLSQSQTLPEDMRFSPESLAEIITMVLDGKITRNTAKEVFERVFYDGVNPTEYVQKNQLAIVNDSKLVSTTVQKVINDNQKAVNEYKSGKDKALGFLIGQVMRALGGKADANAVKDEILRTIN
ncbi:MAG: Asp-tRNA(Asn)/Glu-tRNA(Gln) amidotransferase subunit GatB [Eubacterium sp.]|nr:Asp-tRNA(Asn)/Glu-tRNA(Gln) amidotransferase subunit GatB [Eubacterium sp.]